MVLRVVRDGRYTSNDEAILLGHTRERLGPAIEMVVEHVDKIPRTASGKLLAVVGFGVCGRLRNCGLAGFKTSHLLLLVQDRPSTKNQSVGWHTRPEIMAER